jgi:hypothetical protein
MLGIFRGDRQLRSKGSGRILDAGSAALLQSAMADMEAEDIVALMAFMDRLRKK